jgi:transposase InsO family protein
MSQDRAFLPFQAIHLFPRLYRPKPFLREKHLRQVAEVIGLSKAARARLEWMLWHEAHARNALATSRHFSIAPKTFHKWKNLFREDNLRTLEDRSKTPTRKRSRRISSTQEMRIVALKKAHIRWGKEKIATLYAGEFNERISRWQVQKVIEKYRLYYHPVKQARINRKRSRSVKRKKITDLKAKPLTGFLLCMDTIVIYWKSTKRYIFTAIDKHAKLAFARMYKSKSSRNAADFLRRLHYLCEGRIENAGHDNGTEFKGEFADACKALGIQQYVSRVHTPKDNATNERFNRTLEEEFIQLGNFTADVDLFNRNVTEWLVEYNFKWPHQSLGYLSPMCFIQQHQHLLPMYSSSTP